TPAIPTCTIEISPSSVTIGIGASQAFTTNEAATFAITEPGGGSLSAVTSTSVLYTAPLTPGVYHLVATQASDTDCTDPAVITVIASNIVELDVGEMNVGIVIEGGNILSAQVLLQVLLKGYNDFED